MYTNILSQNGAGNKMCQKISRSHCHFPEREAPRKKNDIGQVRSRSRSRPKKTGKLKRDWILIYDRKNGRKKSVRVEPGFVAGELRLSYVSRLEKGSKSRGGTRPGLFEPDSSLSLGNSGPKEVYRTFRAYFGALWQSV